MLFSRKEQILTKRNLTIKIFIESLLIPIVVIIIYCVSFAIFNSQGLFKGVNYFFVLNLSKVLAIFLLVSGIGLWFIIRRDASQLKSLKISYSFQKSHYLEYLLLLFPLTPIFQYIINNQEILSFVSSIKILFFFLLLALLCIFIFPAIIGIKNASLNSKLLGLAFIFTIYCMAILSETYSWFGRGYLYLQLIIFFSVFLITKLFYHFKSQIILYILIMGLFIINSILQEDFKDLFVKKTDFSRSQNLLYQMVQSKNPVFKPNIYLMIYDSYLPEETMLHHGIDNSEQLEFLHDSGFTIYQDVYSIQAGSIETMSRVLNASTEYYGNSRRGISGDGVVQLILRELGYSTSGIFYSDFWFRGIGSSYDYSLPSAVSQGFIQVINSTLSGEFRFNEDFTAIPHAMFVTEKQKRLISASQGLTFVYSHTNLPNHTQNSGVCLPNELEMYKERLIEANIEMKQDLQTILENDPNGIIIVAGDHGPYLTKNCTRTSKTGIDISEIDRLDIQDRFGTFLAIRWPPGSVIRSDKIRVLQDLFPVVFSYMYDDLSLLNARIEPDIERHNAISEVSVDDGIIIGGINDGEPLFLPNR